MASWTHRPRLALLLTVMALSCLVIGSPAHAFPIPPESLWTLTRRARLVVLAEVTSIGTAPRLPREGSEDTGFLPFPQEELARLRVLEVWKGPKLDEVAVRFSPDVICPAPPSYTEGARVIAFLVEEEGQWYTEGLSYGTRPAPNASAVEAYRTAVREAVSAQSKEAGDAERLDWGLRAAVHPETRWDGLSGLASLQATPSRAQQERLARSFINAPVLDSSLPMTLELLASYRSAHLDAVMVSTLEELLGADDPEGPHASEPFWTAEALDLLATRLGRPPAHPVRTGASALLAAMKEARKKKLLEPRDGTREYARQMRREWRDLKRELRLTPAPLPRPTVRPSHHFGNELPFR
jgi:hypothetical protein